MKYASSWARKLSQTTNPKRRRQILEAMRRRLQNELAQDQAKSACEADRNRELARMEARAATATMDNL